MENKAKPTENTIAEPFMPSLANPPGTELYYIDFLPRCYAPAVHFSALEDYVIETQLKDFVKKMSNIVLKLISYYPAEIYLTEPPSVSLCPESAEISKLVGKNIRNISYSKLAGIIQLVIIHHLATFHICLPQQSFDLYLSGEHMTSIFIQQDCKDFAHMRLFQMLVEQENLYLKKENGTFPVFP